MPLYGDGKFVQKKMRVSTMSNRLILFDTSNFVDYPVGGQLTSIKGFLKYLGDYHSQKMENVLLVGVSVHAEDIGKKIKIQTEAGLISFLAVAQAPQNLNNVKKSLRLEYLKGLYKYQREIALKKTDCVYLHTPEAYLFTHIVAPKSPCFVFSHGTFLNMVDHVRFFQKFKLLLRWFHGVLISIIKNSTCVFVLDHDTQQQYLQYSKNVVLVGNSIVCAHAQTLHTPGKDKPKLLFVGRLSAVKNIAPIIEAAKAYEPDCSLQIVGAGELMAELRAIANERVTFVGAVAPSKVAKYMKGSDILIMNSLQEGIPMTILEGMNMSLPIITTDVGGIGEVVQYGVNAEKTDGTAQSILAAVHRILDNYPDYSQAAYTRALDFDYKTVNQTIFDELNRVLRWD